MLVFVKNMVLGQRSELPKRVDATLQQFFIDRAKQYQNPESFPLDKNRWCREGGCQFAFDRDESAPLRCINCNLADCTCRAANDCAVSKRYALQRFTETRIYLLDIDLNNTRNRSDGAFCKYDALQCPEELELRQMERRLMDVPDIIFFYRTKCNGFRIAFEAVELIDNMERYEDLCFEAERRVEPLTPDRRFSEYGWFKVDRIVQGGRNYRSHAYWSYPRVHNPIWLNPARTIL